MDLLTAWYPTRVQDTVITQDLEERSMSEAYPVDVRSVDGGPTALGWGGSMTVVIDRSTEAGGRGLGFNGGQLLNLAVAGCVSNDLFCEAAHGGHPSRSRPGRGRQRLRGQLGVSTPIEYQVELSGDASDEALADLVAYVDEIAEIPNSIRKGNEGPVADPDITRRLDRRTHPLILPGMKLYFGRPTVLHG